MRIEERLDELGLVLPAQPVMPTGVEIPFAWVRVHGNRAYISGHGALDSAGSPCGPFGKVPGEVSLEQAQHSARLALLAILASLRDAVGDLDRISAWLTVGGHVNAEPGYPYTTAVLNPLSELLIELYGREAGRHARTAIGVATLPLNLPVIVSGEVELTSS